VFSYPLCSLAANNLLIKKASKGLFKTKILNGTRLRARMKTIPLREQRVFSQDMYKTSIEHVFDYLYSTCLTCIN
jgi:hypothetical protein